MPGQVSLRAWNRTLLRRQHLDHRVAEDAIEVLDRCVGLQSQDPKAAFYGLASRIEDFDPSELDELLTERDVVRMATLRGTVFLSDAEDARWIRPLIRPALDAQLALHVKRLKIADVGSVVDAATDLLTGRELSGAHLRKQLAQRFSEETPTTLTAIARCSLPMVQVPPRGLWAGRGGPVYQLFDDWVGPGEPAVTGREARKDLIRLYLRGFGPATVQAVQTWCGLTGLGEILAEMESDWELEKLFGPDGEELYDLDGLGIVDDDPAPARLVAPYDNVIYAAADRRRIDPRNAFRAMQTPNGISPGFVLVDGFLCGSWTVDKQGAISVSYVTSVPPRAQRAVDDEVELLMSLGGS